MSLLTDISQKAIQNEPLTQDEALRLATETPTEALIDAAHDVTRACASLRFDTCSIINARSGRCSENCKWCAQSIHHHTHAEVYPLVSDEECLRQARLHEAQGVRRYSIVTSGRRPSVADMQAIIRQVRLLRRHTRLSLCASLGLIGEADLRALKEAGLERYHCNLETAPSYFNQLCSTHTQADKITTLEAARRAGLTVCSGGIIGMGESAAQRVELALTLRRLNVSSIPINLLQPIAGTPLEHQPLLTEDEVVCTVAVFRLCNPSAQLRFAGGRARLSAACISRALRAGINAAIMGHMLTTPGTDPVTDQQLICHAGYQL